MKRLWVVILCFISAASTGLCADKASKKQKEEPPAVMSYEEDKSAALKAIDRWGQEMALRDPNYEAKEQRILYVIPLIANSFPPNQWEHQVRFFYSALTEMDRKASESDPNAVLSKYYRDEEQRFPSNAFRLSDKERGAMLERRFDEIKTRLDGKEIDEVEQTARTLAVARILFPTDKRLEDYRRFRLSLALRLKSGVIDRDYYDTQVSISSKEFFAGMQQRSQPAPSQPASGFNMGSVLGALATGARNASQAIANQPRPVVCSTIGYTTTCQ